MNKFTVAGIKRGNKFSPNHVGNDAAIFNLTADHLRKKGCLVNEYSELDFMNNEINEAFVFNMVRDGLSIKKLQSLEDDGRIVVNSGYGIENCTREKMTRLLMSNSIAHPKSYIVETNPAVSSELEQIDFQFNYWVKRGDFHAIHREDVTYVHNQEEAKSILQEYALRGIDTAVINKHLIGDLVKFYGVTGTDFFYWFYPSNQHHSKFGLEAINGTSKGIPFDESQLKLVCNQAADILNIHIYGGDCIVAEDSSIRLIDFNDWPSFAPCRVEAAPHIAERIFNLMNK